MTNYRRKYRRYKRRVYELERRLKLLNKLISKINIKIDIDNNPVNTINNKLVNVVPDLEKITSRGNAPARTSGETSQVNGPKVVSRPLPILLFRNRRIWRFPFK